VFTANSPADKSDADGSFPEELFFLTITVLVI
jgi:hypothetical protein